MQGIFVIRNNDKILEFNNYDDIPQSFDNVIKFEPTSPEPPHTEEQHEYIETFNDKLKQLMERECQQLRG